MSDNRQNNFISGNFGGGSHGEGHGDANTFSYTRRTLVEECEAITMSDLRNRFKRKELLILAERERVVRIQHGHQHYEIRLSAEQYYQKWRYSGWSGVTRVWLTCSCGRRARRLFVDSRPSDTAPTLACRTCLQLRYLSQNSGKTKWFRRIVKPLRKLIRRQEKLVLQKRTQRVGEELTFIDNQIFILAQRAKSKRRIGITSGARRPYRNVGLILGSR